MRNVIVVVESIQITSSTALLRVGSRRRSQICSKCLEKALCEPASGPQMDGSFWMLIIPKSSLESLPCLHGSLPYFVSLRQGAIRISPPQLRLRVYQKQL